MTYAEEERMWPGIVAWLVEESKHANTGGKRSPFGWKCLKELHGEMSPELIFYRGHFISIVGKQGKQ